jgi:ATP-dependent DNA helicase PIF1
MSEFIDFDDDSWYHEIEQDIMDIENSYKKRKIEISDSNKTYTFLLPNEIWMEIFSYFDIVELIKNHVNRVNKQICFLLKKKNSILWKNKLKKLNKDKNDKYIIDLLYDNYRYQVINNIGFENQIKFIERKVFKERKNLFITGPAGSGKSYIIKHLVKMFPIYNMVYVVTATTANAAVNIDGITIHKYSGIIEYSEDYFEKHTIYKSHSVIQTDILLIDEISMMSSQYFDLLDKLFRKKRDNDAVPFGGLQLIVLGDFFQLPPINNASKKQKFNFCFKSETWKELFSEETIIELEYQKRQNNKRFKNILNRCRTNNLKEKDIEELKKRVIKDTESIVINEKVKPVYIASKRIDVNNYNINEYNKLKNDNEYIFETEFLIDDDYKNIAESKIKELGLEQNIKLKIGTNIIFNQNIYTIYESYYSEISFLIPNGIRGVIIDFASKHDLLNSNTYKQNKELHNMSIIDTRIICNINTKFPLILLENNKLIWYPYQMKNFTCQDPKDKTKYLEYSITSLFLNYGWALTYHKCQGLTLQNVILNLKDLFCNGMGYVGISRVQSIEHLSIINWNKYAFNIDKLVKEYYEKNKKVN